MKIYVKNINIQFSQHTIQWHYWQGWHYWHINDIFHNKIDNTVYRIDDKDNANNKDN